VNDPAFTRDIWLVPVAINYDRVLEDRSLIRELVDEGRRPGPAVPARDREPLRRPETSAVC